MTPIPALREELGALRRKGHVSGPLRLWLEKVLERVEALEQRGQPIINCPTCAARDELAAGAKV